MTGLLGIMLFVLGAFAGKDPSDEVGAMTSSAKALLEEGHARKAMALLRKARALDPRQTELDRLLDACRARLGLWVSPEASAQWMIPDDLLVQLARERPDSMASVARTLVQSEYLGEAVRVWGILASSHAAVPNFVEGFRDARARQEMRVAFHLDQARRSVARGQLADALLQTRMAWSARPDDPLLMEKVDQAQQAYRQGLETLERDLRRRIAEGDLPGALETVRWIRVAAPSVDSFRQIQDSLSGRRVEEIRVRLREIEAMIHAGSERRAVEAMLDLGDADPQDPFVATSVKALGRRLEEQRRRRGLDSLAGSVEDAIRSGDGARAAAIFETLQRIGRGDSAEQRLRPRLDSIRQAERAVETFNEGLDNARAALARRDLAAGRSALQRALTAKPGNVVARKLLVDVEAAPVASAPIVDRPSDDRVAKRVRGLLVAGVTAYRAGEYETALAQWQEALELDPGCVQAKRYIDNVGKKQERLR